MTTGDDHRKPWQHAPTVADHLQFIENENANLSPNGALPMILPSQYEMEAKSLEDHLNFTMAPMREDSIPESALSQRKKNTARVHFHNNMKDSDDDFASMAHMVLDYISKDESNIGWASDFYDAVDVVWALATGVIPNEEQPKLKKSDVVYFKEALQHRMKSITARPNREEDDELSTLTREVFRAVTIRGYPRIAGDDHEEEASKLIDFPAGEPLLQTKMQGCRTPGSYEPPVQTKVQESRTAECRESTETFDLKNHNLPELRHTDVAKPDRDDCLPDSTFSGYQTPSNNVGLLSETNCIETNYDNSHEYQFNIDQNEGADYNSSHQSQGMHDTYSFKAPYDCCNETPYVSHHEELLPSKFETCPPDREYNESSLPHSLEKECSLGGGSRESATILIYTADHNEEYQHVYDGPDGFLEADAVVTTETPETTYREVRYDTTKMSDTCLQKFRASHKAKLKLDRSMKREKLFAEAKKVSTMLLLTSNPQVKRNCHSHLKKLRSELDELSCDDTDSTQFRVSAKNAMEAPNETKCREIRKILKESPKEAKGTYDEEILEIIDILDGR